MFAETSLGARARHLAYHGLEMAVTLGRAG
jgi:hypothetical protein